MSYQTIIVDSRCKLSYSNNHLIIADDEKQKDVFLDNVTAIIINTLEVSLSSYLLNEMIKRNINVIFCNERKLPSVQCLSLEGTFDTVGRLITQINYSCDIKNKVWDKIVVDKITMQAKLMKKLNIVSKDIFANYTRKVNNGDEKNIEGITAKMYFVRLFGPSFCRRDDNTINALLNYGYSIIAAYVSREIVSMGYDTRLGIKHCSKTNTFNLTYDLIEPFRVFIDKCVYMHQHEFLTKEVKQHLISVVYEECRYNKKKMQLGQAMNLYIRDIFNYLDRGKNSVKELDFI